MDAEVFAQMAEAEDTHWWFAGRREIAAREMAKITQGRQVRILEAGCGSGGNLEVLSRFGEVCGFEPDPGALETARARGIGTILPGELPGRIPFSPQFDVIALFDVLEHVREDEEALRNLAMLASDEARILITVPAHRWLFGAHDRAHHHFRRYSRFELTRKLSSNGWTAERVEYYNMTLGLAGALARKTAETIGITGPIGNTPPAERINNALRRLLSGEQQAAKGKLPWGMSLLAVARREDGT